MIIEDKTQPWADIRVATDDDRFSLKLTGDLSNSNNDIMIFISDKDSLPFTANGIIQISKKRISQLTELMVKLNDMINKSE